MKNTFFGKRFTAGMLAVLILFGTLPVIALPGLAANTNESELGEYVSLPITIRDYAADGMLFEWNELGASGTAYSSWELSGTYQVTVKTATGADGKSVHYVSPGTYYPNQWWYGWAVDKDGVVVAVSSVGETNKSTFGTSVGAVKVIWAHDNCTVSGALSALKNINVSNMSEYKITFSNNAISIYHRTVVGYHGGTRGYGLLQTITQDHLNNLQTSEAIEGSQLVQNGTWNSAPTGTVSVELNSGAKQLLYGAYVRTNLVEAKLDNGKPVYTEATVKYLAEYMRDTLTEVWQNPDGTHNMWYVMGTKLFDDNNNYVGNNSKATRDLAEVFRQCITDGLGTYAATKNKTLTKATDCKTYYDAAYFLLSTLFSDNEGYGQTVSEYHQINLVKKGDAYVFNSAYDDSVYDMTNGVIYNSQTDTITARTKEDGSTESPRGNLLPENRFNPINGLYYGNNSNEYLEISDPTGKDMTYYYANTNYNLTLEGHAQFIFYEDDNMYFNFTGDDDVYLYINGIRVMDMGGAHSISKCGINLNDVKELCGLRDGEVYSFDFFYMERHGTAANFGIETNIRIVDPSMLTEKSAYQNGTEVGNGGYIDASKPVKYQYELTNNGEAKIVDIEFDDPQVGVNLTKSRIQLGNETQIGDLYAAVFDNDGNVKVSYEIGKLTESALKQMLADGLEVGDRIQIFGFNHTITEWTSTDQFTNTVYTKAVTDGNNTRYRTLTGIDTATVKKADVLYGSLHYYEWAGHGVTATRDELVERVQTALDAAHVEYTVTDNDKISLCSASGKNDTDTYKYNPNATVEVNGVKYVAEKTEGEDKYQTGASTYYYKVGEYGPVAVTVYSYDVADDIFVIDYNLPVTFEGERTFLLNDTLKLGENPHDTAATANVSAETCVYGNVDVDGMSITYTMNKFMNGVEEVKLTVTVLENGYDTVTTQTGVVMTETISIAPANVVYYEDDFADIKYIDGDGNAWEYFETSDRGTEQSPDQDTPYGSDPNYADDKKTEGYESNAIFNAIKEWVSSISVFDFGNLLANDTAPTAENAESGNAVGTTPVGDSSNGTIHRLCVQDTAEVMSFEFKGTGFEILSRTTQDIYAVVSVKVVSKTTNEVVKQFPVITECKGGDLYQVPILAVKGLELDTYTVTISAAGGTETKARTLYIDGVRVYQPLNADDQATYYNASEANAEFYEIKNLIGDGKAWYAAFDEGNKQMVSGSTLIENVDGYFERLVAIDNVNDYLEDGPNNELYLSGVYANSFLVLKLKKKDGADVITVQVGAHRKSAYSEFAQDGDAEGTYIIAGTSADDIINKVYKADVTSGTEQYYNIPLTDDDFDSNGECTLFIGTDDEDVGYEALVLTNMKLKGVEAVEYSDPTVEQLATDPLMVEAAALAAYYSDPYDPELSVVSADVYAVRGIFTKKTTATLTVRADNPITRITVTDSDGNEVEVKQYAIGLPGYAKIITATWQPDASRGDILEYTVRAYNADGLASANTVSVTTKVK